LARYREKEEDQQKDNTTKNWAPFGQGEPWKGDVPIGETLKKENGNPDLGGSKRSPVPSRKQRKKRGGRFVPKGGAFPKRGNGSVGKNSMSSKRGWGQSDEDAKETRGWGLL